MGANLKIVVDNYKAEPHYDLEKVPDDILLKYANIEIGQLKSYILELEERLKALSAIKKNSQDIKLLISENEVLKKENKQLKKRKGPPSEDVNIVLSHEDKLRLREIDYRNNFLMTLKKEHDKFKTDRDVLNGENNELKRKVLKLQMQLAELREKNSTAR